MRAGWLAFEIETGNSDIAANVRKVPPGNFDKLVVVATSKQVRAEAERLKGKGLEVIRVAEVEQYRPDDGPPPHTASGDHTVDQVVARGTRNYSSEVTRPPARDPGGTLNRRRRKLGEALDMTER